MMKEGQHTRDRGTRSIGVKGCCQSTKECGRRGSYQGKDRIAKHPARQMSPGGGLRLVKAMMPLCNDGRREEGARLCVTRPPRPRSVDNKRGMRAIAYVLYGGREKEGVPDKAAGR